MQYSLNELLASGYHRSVHHLPAAAVIQSQPNDLQSKYHRDHMVNKGNNDHIQRGVEAQYKASAAHRDSQLAFVSHLLRSAVSGKQKVNNCGSACSVKNMQSIHSGFQYNKGVGGDVSCSNTSFTQIPGINVSIPPPGMYGEGVYDIVPGFPNIRRPPPVLGKRGLKYFEVNNNGLSTGLHTELQQNVLPPGLIGLQNAGLHNSGLQGIQYGLQHGLPQNGLQFGNMNFPQNCMLENSDAREQPLLKKAKLTLLPEPNTSSTSSRLSFIPNRENSFSSKHSSNISTNNGHPEAVNFVISNPGNRYDPANPTDVDDKRSFPHTLYDKMLMPRAQELQNVHTNTNSIRSVTMTTNSSSFQCTVCNVTCLNVETYDIHTQSKQHLSRASGQTADALINKLNQTTESASTEPFCSICNRRYSGTLVNHQRGPEHKRKERLTKRGCVLCQTGPFTTYPEYVKHIDSTEHKQQKDELQSEMKERESLGIAVNPAFISKPGPIKASQIVQDALQKSFMPVVSLKENGITFHTPRTVSTNLISVAADSLNVSSPVSTTAINTAACNIPIISGSMKEPCHVSSSSGHIRYFNAESPVGQFSTSNIYGRDGIHNTAKVETAGFNMSVYKTSKPCSTSDDSNQTITSFANTSPMPKFDASQAPRSPISSSTRGKSYSPKNVFFPEQRTNSRKSNSLSSNRCQSDETITETHTHKDLIDKFSDKHDNLVTVDNVGTCDEFDTRGSEHSVNNLQCSGKVTKCSNDIAKDRIKSNSKPTVKSSNGICESEHAYKLDIDARSDNKRPGLNLDNGSNNNNDTDNCKFIVPMCGYYCSLCDVFYLDADTPHCETQRHVDMLKKVQNGSSKPLEPQISSINNLIHQHLDRDKHNVTQDTNVGEEN